MQGNLQDCTFYELFCVGCNSRFRIVLADESVTHCACPACGGAAPVEVVGKGKTSRDLPIAEFLHRGRFPNEDTVLFYGTPRERRMRFRETLPAAQRAFAGVR